MVCFVLFSFLSQAVKMDDISTFGSRCHQMENRVLKILIVPILKRLERSQVEEAHVPLPAPRAI